MGARLSPELQRRLIADYQTRIPNVELAKRYGISERTVYRILADYRMRVKTGSKQAGRKSDRLEPKPRKLKPCGTNAAYQRHISKGELACDPCLDAHAKQQKDWKKQ